MDKTASELVYVITHSDNVKRRQDAADTLFGIIPSLDEDTISKVIREMTYVITHSDNEVRRKLAQQVLITFKNAQSMNL